MPSGKHSKREDALLEMAIQGNRIGLEYLVDTYQGLALAVAMKIVKNKEDAEEVVQDSFLKAFAALRNFRRTSRFSTWLYRIVYNTALTKRSSRRVSEPLDEQLHPEAALIVENQGHHGLVDSERQKFVNIALSRLEEDDYIIVSLYYLGDKDIASICEIVEMNKSAVKMRLMRARKQLETELGELLKTELTDLL
jgi:RNA polymerase sigma-70 factor (ECF subfamily)